MTTMLRAREVSPGRNVGTAPSTAVIWLVHALAALAVLASATGLLSAGSGPGRHDVTTARDQVVTLFGQGLYAADSWLIGAGNVGQDVAMLLVEVPALLLVVRWYRHRHPLAGVALAGVLSFFTYYYVSMVFGTAQNRMFPVYVTAASAAGFALVAVARQVDPAQASVMLPGRPGPRALMIYLGAVAAALVLAWLPGMIGTAVSGDIAEAVGPYTSAATEALDLGIVVPLATMTVVLLHRRSPSGQVLAVVMLVVNVCIGVVLLAQGAAQLAYGVPLTVGEIVGKSLTFLTLTVVAGGLLTRMALAANRRDTSDDRPAMTSTADRERTPR